MQFGDRPVRADQSHDGSDGDHLRSETTEQHAYECSINDRQHSRSLNHIERSSDSNQGMDLDSESHDDEQNSKYGLDNDKKPGLFRGKVQSLKNAIKQAFPEAIQDLKIVASVSAVEARVRKEIDDPAIFPEVEKVAHVRRGVELCPDEQAFLNARSTGARERFASYMGLAIDDVHPDDVPVVAFGGSGGGFRAMIGFLAYCEEMKKAGLWDCLSYVAGVSGSCWSLAAYYTFGHASMQNVIDHCRKRFSPYHPLSGDAIRKLLSVPGGARITLGPLMQKRRSGLQTVAMDLYSVFTTGWIFFQDDPATHPGGHANKEVAGFQSSWFRWSSAREYLDTGAEPLPIITAVRHERPWRNWKDKEHAFYGADHASGDRAGAKDAWFQWYEITPYEVGCDEIGAWVPTWGFGRPFDHGKSTMQLPEQSLALLLGLATSAPAGPLTSYIATIGRNVPPGVIRDSVKSLSKKISRFWGRQGTQVFQQHHPLHACNEHNFMYHYSPVPPGQGRPPGLENSPRIHLIDSGLDNNCPTYVLLHPRRAVDVIINMDASSDVMADTFAERLNNIGSRRGISFTKRHPHLKLASTESAHPGRFDNMYAQFYDGVPCQRPATVRDAYGRTVTNPPAPLYERACTMVYMPLLSNESAVPNFDPSTAKFSGSYNLVWTPEQVDMVVQVCAANFAAAQSNIKQALYEAWQRKRCDRLSRSNANVVGSHSETP